MTRTAISIVARGLYLAAALSAQDFNVFSAATDPPPQHMLRSYLMKTAAEQSWRRTIAGIRTPADVESRKAFIREVILRKIGGLPTEKAPLNLRRVGTLNRGGYRIERIVFESLPSFYVTANLYVPQTGKPPYPAVLQPLGHATNGKTSYSYQVLSMNLARQGFVVLTFDPIGQGERRIFWDHLLGDSRVGGPTSEHSMVGIQSILAGESVLRYRVWDGIRGVDLLQSLPDVDGKRIGVTGCSGGGTATAFIAALDDRVRTAAPGCYLTAWEDQLASLEVNGSGPQDAEQQFPDQLIEGIDHADLITAMAPKPYLIASMAKDTFPISGTEKTHAEARRTYAILGAEDRLGWHIAPGNHGFYLLTREAIYAWMKRWLKDEPAATISEPESKVEPAEDLWCTETGQVATSLGGETASTWNIKRFAKMAPPRPRLEAAADLERLRSRMREEVRRLTRYVAPAGPVLVQDRGEFTRPAARVQKLVYESGGGRSVPALLYLPDAGRDRKRTVLYVNQLGKSAGGEADQLAASGYTVLALDPSGIGETTAIWAPVDRANTPRPSRVSSKSRTSRPVDSKTTWLALMTGKTMMGVRMEDIVRGLDVLVARGALHQGRAIGFGRGNLAIILLHAAVIDPRFESVVLDSSLVSYEAVALTPIHQQIFDVVIPGALDKYDLPDLVASLAPRPVWIVDATPPTGEPMRQRDVREAYRFAVEAYAAAGSSEQLHIRRRHVVMSGTARIGEVYHDLP